MAKKKTASSRKTGSSSKKKTAAKKTARKATSKKKTARKPAAKKSPARKTSKKVVKKSAAKKTTKKTTKKKTASRKVTKKPATKKTAAKKTTKKTTKKAPAKKSTTKKKTSTSKAAPAPAKTTKAPPPKPRFGAWDAAATKKSQAAAAKLAALAGLAPVQAASTVKAKSDKNTKRLTKSPLTKKQLREFRELLILKRRQILGDVNAMESEALSGGGSGSSSRLPQHMADAGSDTYDQSLALDLVASQRELLKEIDHAIEKIDDNTYGICEELGIPINLDRLQAKPWARLSIEAAREQERAHHL